MKEHKIKCVTCGAITEEKNIKSLIYYVYSHRCLDGYAISCRFCPQRTTKINREKCDLLHNTFIKYGVGNEKFRKISSNCKRMA